MPARVKSFVEAFEDVGRRKAKAILKTILKAVHISRGQDRAGVQIALIGSLSASSTISFDSGRII
jgi:hypothetical protein